MRESDKLVRVRDTQVRERDRERDTHMRERHTQMRERHTQVREKHKSRHKCYILRTHSRLHRLLQRGGKGKKTKKCGPCLIICDQLREVSLRIYLFKISQKSVPLYISFLQSR